MPNPILIEGFTPEEILELPSEHIEQLVLTGEPFDHLARGSRHGGRWLIAAENPQTPRFMHFRYVTHVPRSILLCTRTLGDLRNHARK